MIYPSGTLGFELEDGSYIASGNYYDTGVEKVYDINIIPEVHSDLEVKVTLDTGEVINLTIAKEDLVESTFTLDLLTSISNDLCF